MIKSIRASNSLLCYPAPPLSRDPSYEGASCAIPRMGKNPIFRAPCDRLSHGPQNWDFFPMSVTCQNFPRKMDPGIVEEQDFSVPRCKKLIIKSINSTLGILRTICLRRESLWPGDPGGPLGPGPPRGPPQGGGYYIDDPDPFWAPVFLNFKPVF